LKASNLIDNNFPKYPINNEYFDCTVIKGKTTDKKGCAAIYEYKSANGDYRREFMIGVYPPKSKKYTSYDKNTVYCPCEDGGDCGYSGYGKAAMACMNEPSVLKCTTQPNPCYVSKQTGYKNNNKCVSTPVPGGTSIICSPPSSLI